MRDLHEQLRSLVSQHGAGIAENAEQFRAALDDYLTEADAGQGELNLLVDAVRLGGVERLRAMLDNGADPVAAVRVAGGELARDRSSDEQRSRWAVAAMGYALGRIDGAIVRSQLEGDATRLPYGATAPAAPPSPPAPGPVQTPPYQPPAQSPAWPGPHPTHPPLQREYAAAPPRRGRTGLILGLFTAGIAVITLAVVLAVVAPWEDSEDSADDDTSETTTETCDPCLEGEGYQYELPDGWTEITDQVVADNPGQPTLDTASAWGDSVEGGRANVITEVSAWTYDSLDDALEVLRTNLSALGGSIEDLENRSIDGEEAAGVLLTRDNEAGITVEQRAYIVRNGDDAVVITASHKADDDSPLDKYEEIYDSWSWE